MSLLLQVKFQREEIRNLHIKQGMDKWSATHQALISAGDDSKREKFYRQSSDKSNFSTPVVSSKSTPAISPDQGARLFQEAVSIQTVHPDNVLQELCPAVANDISDLNEYANS